MTAEVGIGYDASIDDTQRLIAEVLRGHDAIPDESPPMVLVDALGAATVNLKAHFWIDGRTLSPHRVRSSALRLIKRALVEHGVSMPDEAREVIFPQGVPLVRLDKTPPKEVPAPSAAVPDTPAARTAEPSTEASSAEGGLGNEISELPHDIVDTTIPEADSGNLLSGR